MRTLCLTLAMLVALPAFAKPLQPRDVPPEVFLDRSGMPELVLQNTLLGGYIGGSLTLLFDDPVRQASGIILGPLLGFGLPFLLKHEKPVHVAEAGFYNFAELLGLFNGALLPQLWEEKNDKVLVGMPGALALAGLGAGIALYPSTPLTPGQVSALGSGMIFGTATGWLALAVADIKLENSQAFAAAGLLFANGGALAAYLARDFFDINRSRMIAVDFGGYLGAGVGLGLSFLIGGENTTEQPQLIAASVLAGIHAGLATTYYLTGDMDDYKRSSNDKGSTLSSVTFNSPAPTVVTSVDPSNGKRVMGWGLNLLNGTW